MTECKAVACDVGASIRGYCCTHYWRRRARGEFGRVSAKPVRRHIKALRKAGWTWRQIDTAAGTGVASQVGSGKTKQVLPETAAKILAVRVIPVAPRFLPAVGIRRRVEALAVMGWPLETVARLADLSIRSACPPPHKKSVLAETVAKVHAVYAKYSTTEGPSTLTAKRAASRGCHPPMAWEYVDIDNPKSRPFQGFYRESA